MIKIAVYGKGGIGKSTTVSNVSAALADMGYKVMQIGCDPKADSTAALHGGSEMTTVLDLVRERKSDFALEDMVRAGYGGVICVEAGGPTPGLGCAGRGIIAALEKLKEKGAYEKYQPDVVIYDVLGDVVCGGFAAPIREGYARHVLIVTSGEKMALYAARNIASAVANFADRAYASVHGIILNKRNVPDERQKVEAFAREAKLAILTEVPRSDDISRCEDRGMTVVEGAPDSACARIFQDLARDLWALQHEACHA